MTDLNKFGHLYQLQRFGCCNAQWGFGCAKQSLSVCVCCLAVCHPMYEIVDISGAEIAVRVGCSLIQSGLVFLELLPLACPDLCNQRLVSSACRQAIVEPLFVMRRVYVFAQLVFNGGSWMFRLMSCLMALKLTALAGPASVVASFAAWSANSFPGTST